jgi:hypothetical protein
LDFKQNPEIEIPMYKKEGYISYLNRHGHNNYKSGKMSFAKALFLTLLGARSQPTSNKTKTQKMTV